MDIHVLDAVVFLAVLAGSLGIGVWHSFGQKSSSEYLQGRRQMGLLPISISMMVSFVSAVTLQGVPAEVYSYGLYQFLPNLVGAWGSFVAIWTFLPLYYNLRLTSIFQYLELRFAHRGPALLASILNIISQSFFMGIATLGPAQILQSIVGTPTWLNILVMTGVCTVYTSIGGIKAVVWADVLQAGIMFLGLIAVIIVGLFKLDGSVDIWQEMEKHGKLEVNWSLNPLVRNSAWIGSLSLAVTNLKVYSAQSAMMRFTALSSVNKAAITIAVGTLGYVAMSLLCAAAAVVVFGYYAQSGCGPLANGEIYSSNQVLAYFVITVLTYPGIPGLFVAAVVSSTLSSVSSVQNGLSAVTWQDLLSRPLGHVTDARKTLILKLTVVMYGLLALCSAYFADVVGGTLFQMSNAALSVLAGGPFGMFILGGAFPFVGPWAAMVACCVGMGLSMWVSVGSLLYPPDWSSPHYIQDTCGNTTIYPTTPGGYYTTTHQTVLTDSFSLTDIYRLSPFLYTTLCTGSCVLTGLLLSIAPRFRQQDKVSRKLVFSFVKNFANVKTTEEEREDDSLGFKPEENKNDAKSFDLGESVDSFSGSSKTLLFRTAL